MDYKNYISNCIDGNISFYAGSGNVLSNRKEIFSKLGLSLEDLVAMNQCHSSNFLLVGKEHKGKGAFFGEDAVPNVDALISREVGIVLMAQGADCPLVAIYNQKSKVIAVIHSGWKGTQKGIIPKVLRYMTEEIGCDHSFSEAIVTPFAKGCCYEVGDEFIEIFKDYPQAFFQKEGKLFFDLGVIIAKQLSIFGITADRVIFETGCTMCGNEHYSYRKEGKDAGRFSLLVWMEGSEY
ncbi:MAG: polyphenol oxidase family protein [Candidatus Riflemargulisbacteria bacterium]